MAGQLQSPRSTFERALELPPGAQRQAYLDEACGADVELRDKVEALLRAHDDAGAFLVDPLTDLQPTAPMDHIHETAGATIGPYKLLELIGEGGFGVVFMAEQERPVQRRVALKVIKPGMDTRQVIARFEAERQALALMDHPNIARVIDAGATHTGRPYFVMELVRGRPITEFCDKNRLTVDERLELFKTVCLAVQHAHQKGIIHRDIKPSNVLVTLHDGKPVAKVIDFGVAKATGQRLTDKTLFTAFAQIIGTPLYMSPEQAEMSGLDVDTRSDIYSLGVLLYELLTGTTPFDKARLQQASYDEFRRIIREEEPPRPSTRLSTLGDAASTISTQRKSDPHRLGQLIRGELDWIVMKCLEKDRNLRYETANALAQDVERHLNDEPVLACPPSARYKLRKFLRKHRASLAVATAFAATLIVAAAVSIWQAARAEDAKSEALASAEVARKAAADERRAREAEAKQRKQAEAISSFLVSAFRSPDPRRDGRTITVAEVLDRSARALQQSSGQDPQTNIALLEAIGLSYIDLGMSREAVPLLEKIRDWRAREFGPDDERTIRSMLDLAMVYGDARQSNEAVALLDKTLALVKAKQPFPPRDRLAWMNDLAVAYMRAGKMPESVKLAEETLARMKSELGPTHTDTLAAMMNLAALYQVGGRHPDAVQLVEETVGLMKDKLGENNEATLKAMSNLAFAYKAVGRMADSLELNEKTLKLRKESLGPANPDTLESMSNLATLYFDLGRTAEGLKLAEELVRLAKTHLGTQHQSTIEHMRMLGILYVKMNRHKEAADLRQERVVLLTSKLGAENADTVAAKRDVVETYQQAGRLKEIVPLVEETLQLTKKQLGPQHQETQSLMTSLAMTYDGAGRSPDALPLLEELFQYNQTKFGPGDPNTINAAGNVAYIYGRANRLPEIVPLIEDLYNSAKEKLGPDSIETLKSLNLLAMVQRDAGNLAESERGLRELVTILRAKRSADDPELAGAIDHLAVVLVRQKKYAEAEPLARECLEIRERKRPDDWLTFSSRSLLGAVLLGQEQFADAEPLLLTGHEGLWNRRDQIPPTDQARLTDARDRLVSLYDQWGKPLDADKWRKQPDND